MKFEIDRNWIEVVGVLWEGTRASLRIDLKPKDIAEIGKPTRENVAMKMLGPLKYGGDFQVIIDFHAIVGETEIPWATEEGEALWDDCNPVLA